jgi:hypothetical protein
MLVVLRYLNIGWSSWNERHDLDDLAKTRKALVESRDGQHAGVAEWQTLWT